MKTVKLLVLGMALITFSTAAQNKKAEQLKNFINRTLEKYPQIPSIGIAVVDHNTPLLVEGFGLANKEKNEAASAQTAYYIASATKSFNGILASILEDEGLFKLDDPITNYAPYKGFENKSLFEKITIKDLLTHQSGLSHPYLSIQLAYTGDYTKTGIIQSIAQDIESNKNGKAFEYTNLGYYLFDVLLQEEFGKNWKELLQEKLFTPLNMKHTTAYISKVNTSLAMPYLGLKAEEVTQSYLKKTDQTMHAAGGLVCTPQDAANWLQFNINRGKVDEQQVYKKSVVQTAHQSTVAATHNYIKIFQGEGYGLGWRTGKFGHHQAVYHFGGYTGFFSHFSFLPKEKLGVAIFVNHEYGMRIGNVIANYAYDLYLGNHKNLKAHEKEMEHKLADLLQKRIKGNAQHLAKLQERSWQLTLDRAKYAGTFQHERIGTVNVNLKENDLEVVAGNLRAVATAFTKDDCVRIELIPKSGTVIQYKIENEEVVGFYYQGAYFKRI